MDFTLTADQLFIRDTLRRFIQKECRRETVHALDEQFASGSAEGAAHYAAWLAKLAEIGLCGLTVPEAFGGGGDLQGAVLAIEELAAAAPVLALAYASISLNAGWALARFGSPAQQQELLPRAALGELKISLALQPDPFPRGSIGAAGPGVRADWHSGGAALDGRAPYVLFAGAGGAHYLLVEAHSNGSPAGPTLFLAPADAPGLRFQAALAVGLRGAMPGEAVFEQVSLSAGQVLGGPQMAEQGAGQLESLAALDQLCGAALGLGMAQGAYLYTLQYARERSQFGQVLLTFEAVEHMLVEQAVQLQALRWLVYHAAWLADQGKPFGLEAAMARLQAGSLARQAGLQSVHILGGYGYMAEYDAQRAMRDALVIFPGGGAPDSLKTRIGNQLYSL